MAGAIKEKLGATILLRPVYTKFIPLIPFAKVFETYYYH